MAKVSVKHVQINKNQSTMLALIAGAVVVVVFGLFATRAMVVKGLYQRKVLHARRDTAATLKSNYTAAQNLVNQYKNFATQDPNILGGSVAGDTFIDGNNPRIILDALPSTYDAPALATSIEKILTTGDTVSIDSLQVTDDPSAYPDQPQQDPQAKAVPFSFEGTASYQGATQALQNFERSIRPFDLNTLELTGTDTALHLNIAMTTYYQPAKSLDLSVMQEVK